MSLFERFVRREWQIVWQQPSELLLPLVFFVLVITLFPLSLGSEPARLAPLAPGILWVSALLAQFLSLARLFRSEYESGLLEQWLLAKTSLATLVFAKVFAFWTVTMMPLLLALPLLSVLLALPSELLPVLWLTLLLGTPTLLWLGAIPAALTVATQTSGMLLALLSLPLFFPVLIFAANTVHQAALGFNVTGLFYILLAFLLLACTFGTLAIAYALRVSVR